MARHSHLVWRIGYWNQDLRTFDSMVQSTVIRDGNFDYVTDSVHWHNTPGFSGTLPDSSISRPSPHSLEHEVAVGRRSGPGEDLRIAARHGTMPAPLTASGNLGDYCP